METTDTIRLTPQERELELLRHLAQHAPRPELRGYYKLVADDYAERLRKARRNGSAAGLRPKEPRTW
jgi:hypothetical protein